MSKDYIFKYTNGYANHTGKINEDEITVEGDCKITNYNPSEEDGKKRGRITINFSDESQTIEEGAGSSYKSAKTANFSNKKFSIFNEIASLDGNSEELSVDDIRKMDKSLIEKWKLKDLRFDYKNGVATLVWGENDILRIDFSTKAEKKAVTIDDIETTQVDQEKIISESKVKVDSIPKTTNEAYKNLYEIIPKEYDKYIKQVAQNAGVSEELVKTFIINEGKSGSKEAVLDAYKRSGDVWTIGFGHTNLCRKMDFKVKEGVSISLQEAFELLEGDIKEMKKYARNSIGAENFDNAPISLQALFIEYCFQYGPGGRLKSPNMKANLAGGYKEAIAAGSLFESGYSRRSAYRFMLAITDFTTEERQAALRRLKSKGNYDKILGTLSGNEKMMFVNFCKLVEQGV